jgi:hypothetical protein
LCSEDFDMIKAVTYSSFFWYSFSSFWELLWSFQSVWSAQWWYQWYSDHSLYSYEGLSCHVLSEPIVDHSVLLQWHSAVKLSCELWLWWPVL